MVCGIRTRGRRIGAYDTTELWRPPFCCFVTLLYVLVALPFLIKMGGVITDHLLFSQTHDYHAYSFHQT